MPKLFRRIAVLLALLLIAGLTWWLQQIVEPIVPTEKKPVRHEPDYYMEKFTVTHMNETGKPRYELEAEYLVHFPDDDTAELIRPRVTVYQQDIAPWTLNAEKGVISSGAEEVFLEGKVLVRRPDKPQAQGAEMRTRDLLVRPDDEYAETDEPVTFKDEMGTTWAVGMRVFMQEERVILLSQVRGEYDAP